MGTGARGEGYLTVEGEQIPILFTNRALAEAEQMTGKGVLQLVREAKDGDMSIGDTANLLRVGLEHARRESGSGHKAYTMLDAWRFLDVLGFGAVAAAVLEAVAAVLAYGPTIAQEDADNPPGPGLQG